VFQPASPTAEPTPLSSDLTSIKTLHALDVDGDGNLDLVAVFTGNTLQCTMPTGACVPVGNGVAVVWGTPTGLGSATSELISTTNGEINDVALLPLAPGDHGHLVAATLTGVITCEVGSDRSLQLGSTLANVLGSSLATADVNGDGLIDLVIDGEAIVNGFATGDQITVLLAESQPIHE
jgi:hypothetical protein